jgi:hypothetical protein
MELAVVFETIVPTPNGNGRFSWKQLHELISNDGIDSAAVAAHQDVGPTI